jgi:hypothetical protein
MPPQGRSPYGTSLMPMQALGAPPPDLHSGGFPAQQGPRPPLGQPQPNRPNQPGRSKAMDYTLKGLGLLGVALVSGFLWWLTHNQAPVQTQNTSQPSQHTGKYSFTPYVTQSVVGDCPNHATNQVASFLQSHQCVSLTRSLWTATLPDGDHVLTSVAVVKMSNAGAAAKLDQVSNASDSGHVKDQVEEGYPVPNGPTNLQNGGYASKAIGSEDVIVMTEFQNGAEDNGLSKQTAAKNELLAVSEDALNQAIGR